MPHMTAWGALEMLVEMELIDTRLKEEECMIRTGLTRQITEAFEVLHYQMSPRIRMLSPKRF